MTNLASCNLLKLQKWNIIEIYFQCHRHVLKLGQYHPNTLSDFIMSSMNEKFQIDSGLNKALIENGLITF